MNTSNVIKKALLFGLSINIILVLSKTLVGHFGQSSALFTDGINSLGDVLVSIMMLIFVQMASKKPDVDHHYGHEKYEGIAYLLLSQVFIATAGVMIYRDVRFLFASSSPISIQFIELSVITAVVSMMLKSFLFIEYRKAYKASKSAMLRADANNHLIDVAASFIALIAIVFSENIHPSFDNIGAMIISVFILKLGIQMFIESVGYLTDKAPNIHELKAIEYTILKVKDVLSVDDLKVRKHMSERYVDVEIGVDHQLTLEAAHRIAERVHLTVEETYQDVLHCMVHVNPRQHIKDKKSERN